MAAPRYMCPECGSTDILVSDSYNVCRSCGLVQETLTPYKSAEDLLMDDFKGLEVQNELFHDEEFQKLVDACVFDGMCNDFTKMGSTRRPRKRYGKKFSDTTYIGQYTLTTSYMINTETGQSAYKSYLTLGGESFELGIAGTVTNARHMHQQFSSHLAIMAQEVDLSAIRVEDVVAELHRRVEN